MNQQRERKWWPFTVVRAIEHLTTEMKSKLAFLETSASLGAKPYLQNDDLECGAIASDGRECVVVWQGKQRAECLLIDNGELTARHSFVSRTECEAFNNAAEAGIEWITNHS